MESNKILWPALKYSNHFLFKIMKSRHYFNINKSIRKYSTENAQTEEVITIKEKMQMTRPTVAQWKRPPFMKDFFRGKFDVELLAFPEILDKEQVVELESNVKNLNNFMTQKVNSEEIDRNGAIPEDVLQELKDMGLFGRTIPTKYGGLNLTHSASTRLNEVLGLNLSIGCTLAAHEFYAAEAILQFGSETQKSQYLPRMASGELIGALCCSEVKSGSDLMSMSTFAKKSPDGNFVLNGTKSWVTNAGMAGLFIVFAKTKNEIDPQQDDLSAFLVEKNKDVTVTLHDKICLRGVQTGVVHFGDVVVPSSNLIGKLGQGFQIYLKSSESFRIAVSSLTIGTLKAFLDSVTNNIIHRERWNKSLADYQLVRTRLSRISSMLYGMESASYFTAAILDSTIDPDVALESAALKLFNSEGALYCLRELIEALGSSSLLPGCQLEKYHQDVLGLSMFDGPNDITRLYLSLSGFKYVGDKAQEFVKKLRNPFFFPLTIIKLQFIRFKHRYGYIKYKQDLAGHIHPSLVEWGNKLERCLIHFEDAVNDLLAEHGKDIVDAQIDPRKLSYIATEFYVWSAVLSRCSRSYCLGMKNCNHEIRLAEAFCHDSYYRFAIHFNDMALGITKNNERNHLFQGEQIIDCQGYFLEHPLKHNF